MITPQSISDPTVGANGGNQVWVSCSYFVLPLRQILVTVDYALPTDVNPIDDFYYGCSSGGTKWNDTDRVFRITSLDQWATAVFADPDLYLTDSDVAQFERVTRQLLQNAEGYAHPCDLNEQPTKLLSRYAFDLTLAAGEVEAQFWTNGSPGKSDVFPIVQVATQKLALNVKTKSGTRALTIELTRGIDYRPLSSKLAGRVRLAVKVVGSSVPSCHRGAAGTLIVSTAPSVLLDVCKQTFLRGESPGRVSISSY